MLERNKFLKYLTIGLLTGSNMFLVGVLLILLIAWGFDVANCYYKGLSYLEVFLDFYSHSKIGLNSILTFSKLFLLPLLFSSSISFFLRHGPWEVNAMREAKKKLFTKSLSTIRRGNILIFYSFCILLITLHLELNFHLQVLLGYCGPIDNYNFCYQSIFKHIYYLWLALSALFIVFGHRILYSFFTDSNYRHNAFNEIYRWLNLNTSLGDYHPEYGDEKIYVNIASMAPNIKYILKASARYNYEYQRRVPTSEEAKWFIIEKANVARKILVDYIFNKNEVYLSELQFEFFTGTSRALEVAVLRCSDIKLVLFSPFEHYGQYDVLNWISFYKNNIGVKHLSIESNKLFDSEQEHTRLLIEMFQREIAECDGGIIIILSEVYWLTGIRINVRKVIEKIRGIFKDRDMHFIIDGTQAVGNIDNPLNSFIDVLSQKDAYYFSAHKWLLSPNTCGVLVSSKGLSNLNKAEPYDVFGKGFPTSTINPNTILGLCSCLEFLYKDDFLNRIKSEGAKLKDIFRNKIIKMQKLQIVESSDSQINDSLYMALRPESGHVWKYPVGQFWEKMRESGINLTVIDLNERFIGINGTGMVIENNKNYWLRVSFPYFLINKNIDKLIAKFNKLLE